MDANIKSIELVLENCEDILIEGKHIGHFYLSDIRYSIQKVGRNTLKLNTCRHLSISINREADAKYCWYDMESDHTKFHRLGTFRDITSIRVNFEDDTSEHYYVDWSNDEYTNQYQSNYRNKFGDLFIVIDKEKTIEDVFSMEQIENQKHNDYVWQSCQ